DEPTTGLDATTRRAIWARLTAFAARQTAILFSTHDLSEARRCSQVLLLSDGRVGASGPPEVVTAQSVTPAGSGY
ncbi:MAG: ABC transporter ATP-binding protein, partial [Gammaproteobacteria bacterium]|nr:ABC transporter ATP-binding protein [Gammaproteobacteria bacterium]